MRPRAACAAPAVGSPPVSRTQKRLGFPFFKLKPWLMNCAARSRSLKGPRRCQTPTVPRQRAPVPEPEAARMPRVRGSAEAREQDGTTTSRSNCLAVPPGASRACRCVPGGGWEPAQRGGAGGTGSHRSPPGAWGRRDMSLKACHQPACSRGRRCRSRSCHGEGAASGQDITSQPWVAATGALAGEVSAWPVRARVTGWGGRASAAAAVPGPVPRTAPARAPACAVLPRSCRAGAPGPPQPLPGGP